jgi:hypothetical protein
VLASAVIAGAGAGSGCAFQVGGDEGEPDPGMTKPPDESGVVPQVVDDGYVPKPFTATRFGVFYQLSGDVIDAYQNPTSGLPRSAGHAWLMTHSHATAFANRTFANHIHQRDDFFYAPAFDIWDDSHHGWQTASDATLRQWAHDFRDQAIVGHADLFTFNECPSTTASSPTVRVQIAKLLRYLHEPDAQGRQLQGVVYFTEKPATASSWTGPASDFFAAIDETSVALVVEHYHSTGFVCSQSQDQLASHLFGFRDWLAASNEPAKVSIANKKFTVLHSSRFSSGPSGWSGGDATLSTLANYQRALSRLSQVTRDNAGGNNRLAFGPATTSLTEIGVQPRITALFRWHYLHTTTSTTEEACVDNFAGNCSCQ